MIEIGSTMFRTSQAPICWLLLLIPSSSPAQEACCEVKVPASLAAQWVPSPGLLEKMRKACGPKLDVPGSRCLLEWMTQDNAAYDAMPFSSSIGVRGYLRHYRQEGTVGVAYVVFPGEKTDRYGIFIVNGDPFRFDPDDPNLPPPVGLQQDARYQALVNQHGLLFLIPREHHDEQEPLVIPGTDGGQRFLFSYGLTSARNGKTPLGKVQVWVHFDASGKFTGRKLESVSGAE